MARVIAPHWDETKSVLHFSAKPDPSASPSVPLDPPRERVYPIKRGKCERRMRLVLDGDDLTIETVGWYPSSLTLTRAQAAFLRDTLLDWLPGPRHPGEGDPA